MLNRMTLNVTEQTRLDLSRFTDEEARHIWQVIQRDFNLWKKEEDRLRDLQSYVSTEDTKRNLLTCEPGRRKSFCTHCLQPFSFLLNSKCQCRNCKTFICKACSWFSKNEHGWLCDSCHMAKILKIGKLEWFHEKVYARFKQSGSAKVMMSLLTRLHRGQSSSQTDPRVGSSFSQDNRHSKGSGRQHCKLGMFYLLLSQPTPVEEAQSLEDLEELELKEKLKELTENISDKERSSDENVTSDEDEVKQLTWDVRPPWGRREPDFAPALQRRMSADARFFRSEQRELPTVAQRRLSFYEVSIASCELSRLEDKVATAVARVQSAQSLVTDIQKKIAALGQEDR